MRMGRHDRARQAFRKVLELDPTSATAYANLGADALSANDVPSAIGDLTRALELEPRQYTVLYNLALALDSVGRRDEARRAMERFVAEAPPQQYAPDIAALQDAAREVEGRTGGMGWTGRIGAGRRTETKRAGGLKGFPSCPSRPSCLSCPVVP